MIPRRMTDGWMLRWLMMSGLMMSGFLSDESMDVWLIDGWIYGIIIVGWERDGSVLDGVMKREVTTEFVKGRGSDWNL
jgi:hypothetical protein